MGVENWIALFSALLGGGGLIGSLILLPKIRAEAKKLNAEADVLLIDRLQTEIARLSAKVTIQEQRILELEQRAAARADREEELERENRQLRAKVARLERRIMAMETVLADVFKVDSNTAGFTELLKKVDEAEARMKATRDGGA